MTQGPGLTPSFGTMNNPNFDETGPFCIPYNKRSQSTRLLFNSLIPGRSGCVFKCNLDIVFLIGIFRSSPDIAFASMQLGLTHEKSSLLQEWLGATSQQAITARYYLCCSQCWSRSMSPHGVTGRMSYSQAHIPSLLPYLGPRENGHHFADDMFKYIFLKEMH